MQHCTSEQQSVQMAYRKFQFQEVKNKCAGFGTPKIEGSREVSSMTSNENFENLSSAQLAYCIWLCWLLVRKIDIDRISNFSITSNWLFSFLKTGLQKQTQYSHRQEGECMMDEMVERLMHVELVLEFKQVEFVLN